MRSSISETAALSALGDRCERAPPEQQRELLLQVWKAFNGNPLVLYAGEDLRTGQPAFRQMLGADAWESAALALMPAGWFLSNWCESDDAGACCVLKQDDKSVEARGSTLALALLAAICRAAGNLDNP